MATLNTIDINEMLHIAYLAQESGLPKIQLNTEHAIELCNMALAMTTTPNAKAFIENKPLKMAAKIVTRIIDKNGGYMLYDDLDKESENHFIPHVTFAGWGSFRASQHNQVVCAAHAACEMGYLENDGKGYRVINQHRSEWE